MNDHAYGQTDFHKWAYLKSIVVNNVCHKRGLIRGIDVVS